MITVHFFISYVLNEMLLRKYIISGKKSSCISFCKGKIHQVKLKAPYFPDHSKIKFLSVLINIAVNMIASLFLYKCLKDIEPGF